MDLGRFVLDKQLLDSNARRCGKVDNLLLAWKDDDLPVVVGILAQQGALAADFGSTALKLVRWIYRALGIRAPKPIFIDWNIIVKIDVVVHLGKTRSELGLDRLQKAIARLIVDKIPGS